MAEQKKKHVLTQSEWEAEMSEKVLSFVKNEIYLDLRFFQIALSALEPKADENLAAFATDGTYLYFSSEQVLRVFQKNPGYLNRAYLHTVLHCLFAHLWIGGNRKKEVWGLACDIAVEYTIDGIGKPCTKRILSWTRQMTYEELEQKHKNLSAAVIYRWLMEQETEQLLTLKQEFYTDDHRYWPKEEQQNAPVQTPQQKKWDKIARQTRMEQKRRGDEKDKGEEILAAQLAADKSRRSYRDFLKKFSVLREELHIDPDEFDLNYYSYGLRLYKNMPLLEPLESRETKKIQEFVLVIDTSYSTSGELIQNFLKETYAILMQTESFFLHSKIRIIQCDNAVRMDEEVNNGAQLEAFLQRFTVVGGGGTDFRPAFTYVNQLIENGELKHLSGLLYFTDGKGIYPAKKPEYKTAFLFLDDYEETMVPPWAIRLRLEPEEFLEYGNREKEVLNEY